MQLITRRPMNRADWAWLMACAVSGVILAVFTTVPEAIYENQPHYGTTVTCTFQDGKPGPMHTETFEVPHYSRQIIIQTNNDKIRDIVMAIDALKLERKDMDLTTSVTPVYHLNFFDFMNVVFEATFSIVVVSYLFRIVVKICGRILGAKTDEVEIVRDPSTAPGQARLAQDDRN
jgi:hypothetical protein